MASYSIEELLSRWARGDLTVEQMTGQILQHVSRLEKEIAALKKLLTQLLRKKDD